MIGGLYKRLKSDGIYTIVAYAREEATENEVVVYRNCHTGHVWTRPKDEFFDGRFERL